MATKFNFPLKPDFAVQQVLAGLAPTGRVKVKALIQVETEDDVVAALLRTLPGAMEVFPPGILVDFIASPPGEPVVVAKPKRDKRKYRSNVMVECGVCHKMVAKENLCKTGECKPCRMRTKKSGKSQPAEKSQDETHPDTWTNQPPEFGREEHIAGIRDKPKEHIDLSKLSGWKVS
jgi:hypothetical protein